MNYSELAKKAISAGTARTVSPEFFKWGKPGQSIVGELLGRHQVESRQTEGAYNQYIFDTDEGPVKCHMGSNYDTEQGALLKIGNVYILTYKGKEDIGGNRSVNRFETLDLGPTPGVSGSPEAEVDLSKEV